MERGTLGRERKSMNVNYSFYSIDVSVCEREREGERGREREGEGERLDGSYCTFPIIIESCISATTTVQYH